MYHSQEDSTIRNDIIRIENGPDPFVTNVARTAQRNQTFRTALWTGSRLQMTLMSIPVRGEIGMEVHSKTDQFIRVEEGHATVRMGKTKDQMTIQKRLGRGDAVFVPAGTWHNVLNAGGNPLKLSTIYAPPHHPRGTVHQTKADAEAAGH